MSVGIDNAHRPFSCFRFNYFSAYQYQKPPLMLNSEARYQRELGFRIIYYWQAQAYCKAMGIASLHPSYGNSVKNSVEPSAGWRRVAPIPTAPVVKAGNEAESPVPICGASNAKSVRRN
jgi:hypothetical protein